MNILYATLNGVDIHNWSGLDFYISKMLEQQGAHLQYADARHLDKGLSALVKKVYSRIKRQSYMWDRDPHTAKRIAQLINQQISSKTDIVFAPTPIPLAYLDTSKPKVFYHDATFDGLLHFYEPFQNVLPQSLQHGHALEKAALDTCQLAIYSSDWAAQSAIEKYGANPEKVKVVPFGANIQSDRTREDVESLVAARAANDTCNLLFLGVNWVRKGGAKALAIAEELNKRGVKCTLHIAGINQIPVEPLPPYVQNHGFISKSTVEGQQRINDLLAQAHFLLLPTLADCTPVVYSEANSFGLPCVSTNVGGIPTIIHDNINGKTFPLEAAPEQYADFIQTYFEDRRLYRDLALGSFNEYQTRLNWQASGETIMSLLRKCMD